MQKGQRRYKRASTLRHRADGKILGGKNWYYKQDSWDQVEKIKYQQARQPQFHRCPEGQTDYCLVDWEFSHSNPYDRIEGAGYDDEGNLIINFHHDSLEESILAEDYKKHYAN